MEVGEAVAVTVASNNHDDECFFCRATDPPEEEENDLEPSPDDDAKGYGGFKNDASKLGKALGGKPSKKSAKSQGKSYRIVVAAHHLIPGNASLKPSSLFKSNKYLWVDGKKKGNIGYNINSAENGVWLPGSYGIKSWGGKTEPFKSEYATSAISAWRAQFHDAHTKYSDFVLEALQKVFEKLEAAEPLGCPKADKKDKSPEEKSPLRMIVGRLNTISGRMRKMLVAPTRNWKRNIYTSQRSLTYMNEQPHMKK